MNDAETVEADFNRNLLLAVDPSDNSRRAVTYVARMLGGLGGFHATLLHVIPEPEEDYFPNDAEKERWLETYRKKIETCLESYRRILLDAGFGKEEVDVRTTLRYCPSMAECILNERDDRRYATLVIGRQGLSRREKFLFGSISSKIVSHGRDCTVWVVE